MPSTESCRYWMGFLNYQRTENVLTVIASRYIGQIVKTRDIRGNIVASLTPGSDLLTVTRDLFQCRGPRWASVNLGIFICMQCSGVHRSLGVHISKVRSATLDTWLPDQVAFIQSMGNEKSNSYWEAELPPKYDRVGIENFIRAKYVDKRWIQRDGKAKSQSPVHEEKPSVNNPEPQIVNGPKYPTPIKQSTEERKGPPLPIKTGSISAAKSNGHVSPNASQQDTPAAKTQEVHQKAETAVPKTNGTPVSSARKVDYATDLFNLLSMNDSNDNNPKSSPSNDNASTGIQSAERTSTQVESVCSNPVEIKTQSDPGIEELVRELQWVTTPSNDKPAKDQKNNAMNFFEKPTMVSPFSIHQQQQAALAQQQSILMATGPTSFAGHQPYYGSMYHPGPINGVRFPSQMMPTTHLQNNMQMGYLQPSFPARGAATPYLTSSPYTTRPVAPNSQMTNYRGNAPASSMVNPSQSSNIPAQSGSRDYDLSSLVQGMFTNR